MCMMSRRMSIGVYSASLPKMPAGTRAVIRTVRVVPEIEV